MMDWNPTTHYQDVAIAERYDRERFSSLSGRLFDALEKRALRKAFRETPAGGVVLDLPCGTGRLAETLLELGHQVIGVDISPAMLEVARRKLQRFGTRFKTSAGDVHELAGAGIAIGDVALCARVLMHFPLSQQVDFLRDVAILAKGTVVFSQSLSTSYQRARRQVKRLLQNQPPAMFPLTEAELATLLKGAGLREVRRFRVSRLLSEGMLVVAEHL
jgi:2-polyprenyl-3-methyl-5-hydroxy-6-metoxy-1,4-benzoquinol methylase